MQSKEKPQETLHFDVDDISPGQPLSLQLQSPGRNPFLFNLYFFSIADVIWDIFSFRMFTYAATL